MKGVQLVQKETLVYKVLQVYKVKLVILVYKEAREKLVILEKGVKLDTQVIQVIQVYKVKREKLETKVKKEILVIRVILEKEVRRD